MTEYICRMFHRVLSCWSDEFLLFHFSVFQPSQARPSSQSIGRAPVPTFQAAPSSPWWLSVRSWPWACCSSWWFGSPGQQGGECHSITTWWVQIYLLGGDWNMAFMTFHRLGIIIPIDFHIFQRGRYTTNQCIYILCVCNQTKLIWEDNANWRFLFPGLLTPPPWQTQIESQVSCIGKAYWRGDAQTIGGN